MDWVRRHLFFLVCGVVSIGAVALGVTGLQRMPEVRKQLQEVGNLYNRLSTLKAVNRDRLRNERRRIDAQIEDRNKVFAKARELYGYEPLVPDALPDGGSLARIEFRRRYAAAMDELMRALHYGEPASASDIAIWQDRIENEKAARQEQGLDPGVPAPPPVEMGPPLSAAGVLTKAGALDNARARASMAAAQRAYCYATYFMSSKLGNKVPSLQYEPAMEDLGDVVAPELDRVWFAQLGYWIQKDVVEAIAAVNEQAADEARKRDEEPWLGIMPVKELISIRVAEGYIPQDGVEAWGTPPGGPEAAFPPATPETVFTHSGSNDWYDVVQFSVKMVMDVRDIPALVDRLCKNSFHTLLRVAYREVAPNRSMVGKIYGSEPTVNVVMDFETIMLGEVFRPLMPALVCEDYGIPCPKRED